MAVLLHVDMDAFFASVEQRDHPEWKGRPIVVGAGPHERGVVSTCSYEARRFGVHSAMPSRTAYQRCPQAIFVAPRMKRYQEVSAQVFEVFGHYTPYVESVSVDEAFLDITGSIHLFGSAKELGEQLRREVRETCGLTCSVGIAPNRLLAKIGSEQHKPDGLTLMPFGAEEIASFLAHKPIGILWGVGESTEKILRPFGLTTCGDIQRIGKDALATILHSERAAEALIDYAFGRSEESVAWQEVAEKSVSREQTFGEDCSDRECVRRTLLELVEEVGRRFRKEKRWARTARLKLRDSSFRTFTRQAPFPRAARDDLSFRKAALTLFDEAFPRGASLRIRLIGFGVANLQNHADEGLSLFADPEDERLRRREILSETIDALRTRGISVSTNHAAEASFSPFGRIVQK